ncbi:hypothetical protein QUF72_00025 [Desulfobacterales bacterium HSG2]|nr:hypothetical protein [Desulfobacterales bacterium HSG2]
MSKKTNLYLGKAGQMAVMSEFLARGWNVAVPEVDVGDDIFVVRDSDGNLSRIQVKTGSAKEIRNGYSAQFSVPLRQLMFPVSPELSYIFAVRRNQRWESFVIIQRDTLNEEYQSHNVGSQTGHDRLMLYMRFFQKKVVCSKRDFTVYLNRWDKWKQIFH